MCVRVSIGICGSRKWVLRVGGVKKRKEAKKDTKLAMGSLGWVSVCLCVCVGE